MVWSFTGVSPTQSGGISSTALIVIGGIFTAMVAGIVAGYFALRNTRWVNSGNIKNSTASDLWEASNKMREELAERLVAAEAKAEAASQAVAEARHEAEHWRLRALEMELAQAKMKRQIQTLQRQVRELRAKQRQ